MSHIVEFKVSGLAGRKKDISLKLDRHLNVFYGFNGCGKTSLLKILHSAMSGDINVINNVNFDEAEISIYSLQYDSIFVRKLKKKPEVKRKDIDFVKMHQKNKLINKEIYFQHMINNNEIEWIETAPKNIKINHNSKNSWFHRYLPTTRLHLASDNELPSAYRSKDTYNELTEEDLDTFFAESLNMLWMNYSADVFHEVRRAQEDGLASILQSVLSPQKQYNKEINTTSIGTDEAYKYVKNFFSRQVSHSKPITYEAFKNKYNSDTSLQQIVFDIYNVEKQIEVAMSPRTKLQKLIEKLYSGGKSIKFEDKSISVCSQDGNQIGLASLSSGEKHLLKLLVETLMADKNTIIIDEPELSLHIDWQRELINIMQLLNPGAQFILATHSPEIMAELPDDRIYEL